MSMPDTALARLNEVEARFARLEEEMADPACYMDPERLKRVARARADLEETVATYREYKAVLAELEESRRLRASDPDLRELAEEEEERLLKRAGELESRLVALLVGRDPLDEREVFLEIRAGTGGEEAALFAADLFRAYVRFGEKRGFEFEVIEASETELGGFREVVAHVHGERVYGTLKYEAGVHRVQRIPVTEAQGRIHTSTVTVAVLPEADEVDVVVRDEDVRVDLFRAHGAGGQHVNKTDSAVRLTHLPTGIVVVCQDERSQHKNRAKAMKVLRARLADLQRREAEARERDARRAMVGSAERSERIRTYNYPQNRVTDHRIGLTLYRLDAIMEGEMDEVVSAVQAAFAARALAGETG